MKKILFIGAYGIENAGDDLPMVVMIDNLKKLSPTTNFEFHALTRHVNQWDKEKYGVIYHQNLEYENREESEGKWFRGLNYHDDRAIFNDFAKLIKSMDLLIIGAGNFIIDISIDIFKGPIPLIWWYIHLAKLYDKKVFLYGISTAPLVSEYSQLLTKEIMNKSDIVTVRDNASKQYLKSLNVKGKITVLPDPTLGFAFPVVQKKHSNFKHSANKNLTIAIGLRSLKFLEDSGQKVFDEIVAYINNNPKNQYIFVPQSTYFEDNDVQLAQQIRTLIDSHIEVKVIDQRHTPQELIEIYSSCDVTIAIRLHSAVFSQIALTPAIAINYLPKIKAYMEDFGTISQLLSIEEIKSADIHNLIELVLDNKELMKLIKKQNTKKYRQTKKYACLALSLLHVK
jgi:polysaccharide pyruvyl transferase WcaK-like protein